MILTALLWSVGATAAQDAGMSQSPILLIDPDRFFTASEYGQRVAARIEAEEATLRAENRRIEAELTEEEKSLTEKRPTMTPADFRAAADAFDQRVQEIRRVQDRKAASLLELQEQEQVNFARLAQPVLIEVLQDRGASVLLNVRSVVISIDAIDVTGDAIDRLNQVIGDGSVAAPVGTTEGD